MISELVKLLQEAHGIHGVVATVAQRLACVHQGKLEMRSLSVIGT